MKMLSIHLLLVCALCWPTLICICFHCVAIGRHIYNRVQYICIYVCVYIYFAKMQLLESVVAPLPLSRLVCSGIPCLFASSLPPLPHAMSYFCWSTDYSPFFLVIWITQLNFNTLLFYYEHFLLSIVVIVIFICRLSAKTYLFMLLTSFVPATPWLLARQLHCLAVQRKKPEQSAATASWKRFPDSTAWIYAALPSAISYLYCCLFHESFFRLLCAFFNGTVLRYKAVTCLTSVIAFWVEILLHLFYLFGFAKLVCEITSTAKLFLSVLIDLVARFLVKAQEKPIGKSALQACLYLLLC